MTSLLKVCALLAFTIITPYTYGQEDDGIFRIVENDRAGYMDSNGKILIKPIYKNGYNFSEGLAPVRAEGCFGYINKFGIFVLPPVYDYALCFNNGIARVYLKGRALFINKAGEQVLPETYSGLSFISNTKAIVTTKCGRAGLMTWPGRSLIIDTIYNELQVNGSMVKTTVTHKSYKRDHTFLDTQGHAIPAMAKFEVVQAFGGDYTRVTINDSTEGVVNMKGQLLFSKALQRHCHISGDYHDGLARIALYKYWLPDSSEYAESDKEYEGYIDLQGNIVLNDTNVKHAGDFSNGRAFVTHSRYEGSYMINARMEKIAPDTFEQAYDFEGGYAVVKASSGWGVIDTNGKIVVPFELEKIRAVIGKYVFFSDAEEDGDFGILTLGNKLILNSIMDDYDKSGFRNGILKATINNRQTFIDEQGNTVWQEKIMPDTALLPVDIDFMVRGYFYAFSSPSVRSDAIGLHYGSRNFPRVISGRRFEENKLSVVIDTAATDTFDGKGVGLSVYIANTTADTVDFDAQDTRIYMKMQAQDENGNWKDIEYLPRSWCGNSYHTIRLEPGAYWQFKAPRYSGHVKTKMRAQLEYRKKKKSKQHVEIFSNTIDVGINPAQFWRKRDYSPRGLMDPYND